MFHDFIQRGYPERLLRDAFKRAASRDRTEILQGGWIRDTFKGVTAAIDYTQRAAEIKQIIHKHWHIVSDIPGCKELPRIGLHKILSIKNFVTRSDMRERNRIQSVITGHHKCGGCSCCHQAWLTKQIEIPSENLSWEIDFYSSCNTKMCIYVLKCVCGKFYVGSTRRKLKLRIIEHRSRIRNNVLEASLVQHFSEAGHAHDAFQFAVLEIITSNIDENGDPLLKSAQRETFCIYRLQTLQPKGLNSNVDFASYLCVLIGNTCRGRFKGDVL